MNSIWFDEKKKRNYTALLFYLIHPSCIYNSLYPNACFIYKSFKLKIYFVLFFK